jgi:hypothetical protein
MLCIKITLMLHMFVVLYICMILHNADPVTAREALALSLYTHPGAALTQLQQQQLQEQQLQQCETAAAAKTGTHEHSK